MRRKVYFSILLAFILLAGGCIFQTENSVPVIGPPPDISNPSFVSSGGTAIAIAFKADEISTTSPKAKELFLKGLTYSTQYARYNESLEFFDAALAIDRNFSEAWIAKGVALHNLKRYDEAIRNYNQALSINPDDAGTWHLKAVTLRDAGRPEESAESARRAAELDPAGYGNLPGAAVTPAQTQSCSGRVRPVPAGGDVYLGESCLDVIAGVPSGQGISWYKNGRNPGNATPDETRIVRDARNFFADPEEFLGYEGNWYVGSTDKVAFVMRVVDLRLQPWDNSTLPSDVGNQQATVPVSFEGSGKIEPGLQETIAATKDLDYVTAWVVLDEPAGLENVTLSSISPAEQSAWRERQRVAYLNSTKPVVDYVRNSGFVVDYIGQTSPAVEVLTFPPFMKELANRSDVRKMVLPKTNHQVISEMLLRKPDETLRVSVSFTPPPGFYPWPHGIAGKQLDDYYSQNRIPYENHTRHVLGMLAGENVSITFRGPYPTMGIYGEVPVYLLEDFNGRPEVGLIQFDVPAYLV